MEQSSKPTPKRASNAAILAKVNAIMSNQEVLKSSQEEFKDELRHLRQVVIGNGDDSSMLNQIKQLEFGQAVAKSDRERMENQMSDMRGCVSRLEKDELESKAVRNTFGVDQQRILERLDKIETTQEEHGTLIAAFRNRVIGIVAVLSLLAGGGAGFIAAAKLLSAAVP